VRSEDLNYWLSIWKYLDDNSLTTERNFDGTATRQFIIEFIFRWQYWREVNDCNHFWWIWVIETILQNAENTLCLAIAFSGAITVWWNHEAFVINTRDRICRHACSDVRIVSAIHSSNNMLFASNTWYFRCAKFHSIQLVAWFSSEPEIESAIINIADVSTSSPLLLRVKNRPILERTRARKSS